MKATLTPNICYMAGLYSKASKKEKNFVSISTNLPELQQRFVEIAVNDLGIIPSKILLGRDGDNDAGFYHSRVAKQLLDIANRETYVFKVVNDLSRSYLAGMFDIAGHYRSSVEIRHVSPKDAMMLENLGIHTRGDRVMNVGRFISLLKGHSIVLRKLKLDA